MPFNNAHDRHALMPGMCICRYTNKGRAFNPHAPTLGDSLNTAFIGAIYANIPSSQISYNIAFKLTCFARSQIRYVLGDAGRSLVSGLGKKAPTHVQVSWSLLTFESKAMFRICTEAHEQDCSCLIVSAYLAVSSIRTHSDIGTVHEYLLFCKRNASNAALMPGHDGLAKAAVAFMQPGEQCLATK